MRLAGDDVHIEWRPGEGLRAVRIDPEQLYQVMAELTANARDAMDGRGVLTIETGEALKRDPGGTVGGDNQAREYVFVKVTDTGPGIAEENLSRVFEPFFTTKGIGEAAGLGLAVVHGIIAQNDGFIDVEGRTGKGAAFTVHLPALAGRGREDVAEVVVKVKGGTVLLVEDDPLMLEMGRMMIERLGYTALTAGSPYAAISLAEQQGSTIDLIIAGKTMPEMSGEELARKIASIVPGVRVRYCGPSPSPDEIERPFSLSDLDFKIKAALKNP